MWTDRHRTRHETRLKDLVLRASLDEVARFLERADPPGSPDATPARRVLAGIAWHLRVGGAWRALPNGFLPWRTVYGWFRRWIDKGLFEALMRSLARRQRRRCGRRTRLAIIDTQSVKCIGVRGPRGDAGAKKLVGRKRVALVEAEGHVLALAVVPANVQDRDTLLALDDGKEQWPSLRLAILDGAFTAERCQDWCHLHGMVTSMACVTASSRSSRTRRASSCWSGAGSWSAVQSCQFDVRVVRSHSTRAAG
jgi:putative transposase